MYDLYRTVGRHHGVRYGILGACPARPHSHGRHQIEYPCKYSVNLVHFVHDNDMAEADFISTLTELLASCFDLNCRYYAVRPSGYV